MSFKFLYWSQFVLQSVWFLDFSLFLPFFLDSFDLDLLDYIVASREVLVPAVVNSDCKLPVACATWFIFLFLVVFVYLKICAGFVSERT